MHTITAPIGYMSQEGVAPDTQRPGNVLRAPSRPHDDDIYQALSMHNCALYDLDAPDCPAPSLATTGFDRIDLNALTALQHVLQIIRANNHITPQHIRAIRRHLMFQSFPLADGRTARILFIAGEGTILRKAGPNGMKINPDEPITDINGHDGAQAVHGDQDVHGTPIRQILFGLAPRLFNHVSPESSNQRSKLHLLNVWIPLQQITRPLVLMDNRTLNRQQHQLRYALPTEAFFDRPEDRQLNDIWAYLHDPAQQWYFTPELDSRRAYVFNTLCTPHGACILPGEAIAEQCYKALQQACRAIQTGNLATLADIAVPSMETIPEDCTTPLRHAINTLHALLREAQAGPAQDWHTRALAAMDKVVRKSIEMRAVCWVS